MEHRSVKLELRVDKPENVYRFIYDWKTIPTSYNPNIFYLILHALVQWDNTSENTFCVLMQYSTTTGENVDVSEPAHIIEKDLTLFNSAWSDFVQRRIGKR